MGKIGWIVWARLLKIAYVHTFLALLGQIWDAHHLSQVTGSVRMGDGCTNSMIALGGLNEIFTADFYQFPLVGQSDVALYTPVVGLIK